MREDFRLLIDFMARELITVVVENAEDFSPDDSQRVADVARGLLDSVDLNEEVMKCVRSHLAVK